MIYGTTQYILNAKKHIENSLFNFMQQGKKYRHEPDYMESNSLHVLRVLRERTMFL